MLSSSDKIPSVKYKNTKKFHLTTHQTMYKSSNKYSVCFLKFSYSQDLRNYGYFDKCGFS